MIPDAIDHSWLDEFTPAERDVWRRSVIGFNWMVEVIAAPKVKGGEAETRAAALAEARTARLI